MEAPSAGPPAGVHAASSQNGLGSSRSPEAEISNETPEVLFSGTVFTEQTPEVLYCDTRSTHQTHDGCEEQEEQGDIMVDVDVGGPSFAAGGGGEDMHAPAPSTSAPSGNDTPVPAPGIVAATSSTSNGAAASQDMPQEEEALPVPATAPEEEEPEVLYCGTRSTHQTHNGCEEQEDQGDIMVDLEVGGPSFAAGGGGEDMHAPAPSTSAPSGNDMPVPAAGIVAATSGTFSGAAASQDMLQEEEALPVPAPAPKEEEASVPAPAPTRSWDRSPARSRSNTRINAVVMDMVGPGAQDAAARFSAEQGGLDDTAHMERVERGDGEDDGRRNIPRNNLPPRRRAPPNASFFSAVLKNKDIGRQVVGLAGKHFLYLGTVCKALVPWLGEDKKTEDSEVVVSVPRTLEALSAGWSSSEGALKEAASLGSLEVLKLLRRLGVPWCDGLFAAAADNNRHDVMVWLIERGCPKDALGLKALVVAIESGSPEILSRCFEDDVAPEDRPEAGRVAVARLKCAFDARELSIVGPLSRFLGASWGPLYHSASESAEAGDWDMVRALKEFISSEDWPELLMNIITTAARKECWSMVLTCLDWYWERNRPYHGDQRDVPNDVLFQVAWQGNLEMLQWFRKRCPLVSAGFCYWCIDVEGWERVPEDAARAGHVDMVIWCLDNGWEYRNDVSQSAASEGRSNVVAALGELGYSCVEGVSKESAELYTGVRSWEKFNGPKCHC